MLGVALWFAIALTLLAGVLLDGAAAFARASLHAAADHAIESALHDTLAGYQNALQTAIANASAPLSPAQPFTGAPPSLAGYASALASLPNPWQTTVAPPAGSDVPFTVSATVTPTTLAAPACGASAGSASSGPDAIAWLQCSGFVQESRLSVRVDVEVLDANGGAVFAEREEDVTLRLFAEPPYSAVVGHADGRADAPTDDDPVTPPVHEGDLGGDTVSGAPLPSPSPWPAGGTLIHVRYQCVDGTGSCANATPPDPDAALQYDTHWQNGNAPPP
ncbi:MAG TPA: hypothetical protein VMD91_02645 [Candidatus Sulfotelmatobacter sp.]|nr:hypothetical protein [Candidatus Sulfotelmatobacter sp.]